jgi:hypothetical protein
MANDLGFIFELEFIEWIEEVTLFTWIFFSVSLGASYSTTAPPEISTSSSINKGTLTGSGTFL